MSLRVSWVVILVLHAILIAVLWRNRKRDHPGLVGLFGINASIDFLFFLFSRTRVGGLDLLQVDALPYLAQVLWYGALDSLWLLWFVLVVLAAVCLEAPPRRWWWLPVGTTIAVVCLDLLVGYGALPQTWRFGLLHLVVEPALLVAAVVLLLRHLYGVLQDGRPVDILILGIASLWLLLLLRLVLALRPDLSMVRSVCHATFYTVWCGFVVSYYVNRHSDRWLFLV